MIQSFELVRNHLKPASNGDYHSYEVSYIYEDEAKLINELNRQYNVKLDEIVKFDDEVACDCITDDDGGTFLFISFLLPELNSGLHLDNLVTSTVILIFDNKLIFVTKRKIKSVINLLSNFPLLNSKNFVIGVTLKMLDSTFGLMIDELRSLKKKIDKLETSITKTGPVKPVFSDLLLLQKYMLTLSSTYQSNKKVINFLKNNFHTIGSLSEENEKAISRLYDKIDTMNRIITSYSAYLDNLESMINNMASYQLNTVMKTLTEISIILTVPAIIFGLWGINVHVPFEKSGNGLWFVVGISIMLSVIVWLWLRRKKYF